MLLRRFKFILQIVPYILIFPLNFKEFIKKNAIFSLLNFSFIYFFNFSILQPTDPL